MPNSMSPASTGPTSEQRSFMPPSVTMQGELADSAESKRKREVRNRLVMGPILILFVLGVFALDEWMEGTPLPQWLYWTGRITWSAGAAILPVCVGIALLASREMATILSGKGIAASKRIMSAAAIAGLLVSSQAPNAYDAGFNVTDA